MSVAAAPRPRRGPARRGRPGNDQGSASIEFAITAVAVMALIFAAIQAATFFWAREIAQAAAREGVNAQRAYNAAPGIGANQANAFIASTGDGLTGTTVTINYLAGGTQVQATVTGHCLSVIPAFCNAFPVHATIHGTVERITDP